MRAMLPFVALLGCTAPPPPMASLPADSVTGVGDLTRAAILAAEFDVFVQLGFSLLFRTRQLKPILDRLEAAVAAR